MTERPPPSIKDLIAATPGAQTREQALASLKARRSQMLASAAPVALAPTPEPEFGDAEWAKKFHERVSKARTQRSAAAKAAETANDNEV